jgi:hypothetical protein
VAQVRRARAATPWRTVKFARSIKAVLSRPDRPTPCKVARISGLCPQAHDMRHTNQLAPSVAFLHLAVDQPRRHLPLASMLSLAISLEPVSKMGGESTEIQIEAITGEERQAERRPGSVGESG